MNSSLQFDNVSTSGLDPGQPYFEGTQPEVHLDATDAEFVDIIHTDGRDVLYIGFGFKEVWHFPDTYNKQRKDLFS